MYVYDRKTIGGDLRKILDPRKVPSKEIGGPVPKGTLPGHCPGPRLRGQQLAHLEVNCPGPPPEGAM
jgi:hypothetical protein